MLCTYCGRTDHVAASCRVRRPRLSTVAIAAAMPLVLGACSANPVEPADIAPPAAHLLKPPSEPMAEIPHCESEPRCRSGYYAQERAERSELRAQVKGLQAYVRNVRERR